MLDEEIIKALECCIPNDMEKCLVCPFHRDCIKQDKNHLAEHTLDLINRQKAEIERLQTAKSFECNVTKFFDRYKTHIKAEAVKEVIETMKPWYRFLYVDKGDWYEQLDTHAYNLVKGMAGEG